MLSEGQRILGEHVGVHGARETARQLGVTHPLVLGALKGRLSDGLRDKMSLLRIPPSAWDTPAKLPATDKVKRVWVKGKLVDPPDDEPVDDDDGETPDAQALASSLLKRVQRYARDADRAKDTGARLKYFALEQRAIAEVARLTGQSATNEAQLSGSPAWLKLRDLILAALSEHPDAARAVLGVLDETLP